MGLQKAIDIFKLAGKPQAELAAKVGVSPMALSNWKRRGVPPERVLDIERATGGQVSRHELRPDIYPPSGNVSVSEATDA